MKTILILSIILMIYIYLLFRNRLPSYQELSYPFTCETTDFETLKRVCLDKVELVKRESGLFQPYNEELMKNVESVIKNSKELKELVIASLLMPNNCIGLDTIEPLKDNMPINSTLFQFERGNLGWYWGYSTYTNPISNIMYYIIRIELGTKEIRKKYNLPLGSTTVYSISLGIGNNGVWRYTPYIVCGGKYEIFDKTKFKFSANFEIDLTNIGYTIFQTIDNGFKIDMGWSDNNQKYESSTFYELDSPTSPSFNGIDGCAPCFSGIGTLYWSYTNFKSKSYIKTPEGILNVKDGDGWLDHQWMRSNNTNQLINDIIINILSSKKGFGRYIWINLHIKKPNERPLQYMVYAFPDENIKIKEGLTFNSTYNIYSKYYNNILNKKDGTIKILKTTVFNDITYATLLSLDVTDFQGIKHTYTIDCSPYGDCATIDFTGNYHWTSSTTLYEGNNSVGTGFLEQNQFQNPKLYRQNTLNIGNFDKDVINIEEKLTTTQLLPSFITILIPLIIILYILFILIKMIFTYIKNSISKY